MDLVARKRRGWILLGACVALAVAALVTESLALVALAVAAGIAAAWLLKSPPPRSHSVPAAPQPGRLPPSGRAMTAVGSVLWAPGLVLVVTGLVAALFGAGLFGQAIDAPERAGAAEKAELGIGAGLAGMGAAAAGTVLCAIGIPLHLVGRGRERERVAYLETTSSSPSPGRP